MKKRTFIKVSSIAAAGSLILPISSCTTDPKEKAVPEVDTTKPTVFELPALKYEFNALEPHIDARTMEIHHGKHHAGYVKKLNAALAEDLKFVGKDLETILATVEKSETAVRNNGGGHYNHTLYWQMMSPQASEPKGDLLALLTSAFGSFEIFEELFSKAATSRFGSGWAWLSLDKDNRPVISSTPNQDNPLMKTVLGDTMYPLFGIDVWEHAYYLKYQNRRGDYVKSFLDLVNWDAVAERFKAHMAK